MAKLIYRLNNLGSFWCIDNHCHAIVAQGKLTYKFQLHRYLQYFSKIVLRLTGSIRLHQQKLTLARMNQNEKASTQRQAQKSASHTRSTNLVSLSAFTDILSDRLNRIWYPCLLVSQDNVWHVEDLQRSSIAYLL